MKRSTAYLVIGLLSGVVIGVGGVVFWAADKDVTEVYGAVTAFFSAMAVIAGPIVKDIKEYNFAKRRTPADLQRRTHRLLGVPIVDD